MTRPSFGVALQGRDPPAAFMSLVREIEALGYDRLWLTDSSLHARDVWAYLALAATASRRLGLGSAVTNPLTRHPAIGALAAATVDEISGGRLVVGVGAGDRPMRALGYAPARLATLRAAIEASRRLWRGEHVTCDDLAFELSDAAFEIAARPEIPVYVSATGPRTLELAGEIADGVILLAGLFPEGVRWAVERVAAGARRSGRPMPRIVAFAYGSIRDDAAAAVEEARSIAAWFCQTAPAICELAGMPAALIARVREAYSGGEFQLARRAGSLIPADSVRRLALAGTPADARAKVEMLLSAGVSDVTVFPLGAGRLETVRRFAREVLPAFRA